MLTITKKLDMSPHGVPQVIRVSQYDSDFTLEFKLFASGGNFAISTGTTAEIRGTKQSGTGYSASATLDTSTKVVTVAGAAQMTAVAGMNIFEIVLKKNNKEISSANFCLLVERAALDADTITDESVLKELNAIIESADTATQAAEEAEDAADRAEAAAQTLVIDPTLTQSGQAADAKATGDALAEIRDDLSHISGLSEDAKQALLACFRHVAWTDEHGQDYYDALASALSGGDTGVWEWEWTPTGGNLTKLDGSITINNSKACINSTNNTMRTTRRAFCAKEGIDPYIDTVTLESRGVYPIPIPKTANKVTLSISPSERQVFGYLCKYDSVNNTYSNMGSSSDTISFTNGSGSLEFTPNTYQYLLAGTRHSASGTYTEEPTGYNVLFEVV